jgi:hypothetical protein
MSSLKDVLRDSEFEMDINNMESTVLVYMMRMRIILGPFLSWNGKLF